MSYRTLPLDLLPESIAVAGDGEYGTYVRYIDGEVSVLLAANEDLAETMTASMVDRTDVVYAETIARG